MKKDTTSICVFGGSITWGAYDDELGGWVQRLRIALDRESNGYAWVYNLGICDDTTTDVLRRLPTEAAARKPDVIILSIGLNDAQYIGDPEHHRTSPEEFQSNVAKLAAAAKASTSRVVFLGLTDVDESRTMPISWMPDRFYSADRVAEYDALLRAAAEVASCRFISLRGVLTPAELDDGIHPTAAGHEKIFRAVRAALAAGVS